VLLLYVLLHTASCLLLPLLLPQLQILLLLLPLPLLQITQFTLGGRVPKMAGYFERAIAISKKKLVRQLNLLPPQEVLRAKLFKAHFLLYQDKDEPALALLRPMLLIYSGR
jgi:hypothetical protein